LRRVYGRGKFDKHFLALSDTVKREIAALINALRFNPNQERIMDIRWTRANAAGQLPVVVVGGGTHHCFWMFSRRFRLLMDWAIRVFKFLAGRKHKTGLALDGLPRCDGLTRR
jgi:hypothetical protein